MLDVAQSLLGLKPYPGGLPDIHVLVHRASFTRCQLLDMAKGLQGHHAVLLLAMSAVSEEGCFQC